MAQFLYSSLRDMFGMTDLSHLQQQFAAAGIKPTPPPEGSLSVESFSFLRGFLGTVLPSRFYADIIIGLVLVGFVILLAISIFSSCRKLGFAFIMLGLQCFGITIILFWLYTIWKLSNEEYHTSFINNAEWLLETWRSAQPRAK